MCITFPVVNPHSAVKNILAREPEYSYFDAMELLKMKFL